MHLQLVDKHGQMTGSVTYSAAIHSAHQSSEQQQPREQQLSVSSLQSEQFTTLSEGDPAEADPGCDTAANAVQEADFEAQHQPVQADKETQELRHMQSEAFLYSSTGKTYRPCCQGC